MRDKGIMGPVFGSMLISVRFPQIYV